MRCVGDPACPFPGPLCRQHAWVPILTLHVVTNWYGAYPFDNLLRWGFSIGGRGGGVAWGKGMSATYWELSNST